MRQSRGAARCISSPQQTNAMKERIQNQGPSGEMDGLALIGAAIYSLANVTGFWMGALGLLKALVWPAFLVYEALRALGA